MAKGLKDICKSRLEQGQTISYKKSKFDMTLIRHSPFKCILIAYILCQI